MGQTIAARSRYRNIAVGGGGGSPAGALGLYIYPIGGSTRDYQNTNVTTYLGKCAGAIISPYSGWEASEGVTVNSVYSTILGLNPNAKIANYTDSTRTQYPGFRTQIIAANQYVANSYPPAGDPNLWDGDYVLNYASTATDSNGDTAGQADALYRWKAQHLGTAEGFAANLLCFISYWDDVFGGIWRAGLFSATNAQPATNNALVAGYIAAWTRYRAIAAAAGYTGLIAANLSQAMSNLMPAQAITDFAGQVDLGLVERAGSLTDSNWFGTGNLVDKWNSYVEPLLTPTGKGIFDSEYTLEATLGTTEFNRQVRLTAAACFTVTNGYFGPLIDKDANYIPLEQYLVWRDWFDVNLGTGVAKSYASAGLGFAYAGNAVDAKQTAQQPNGLVVRKFDNMWAIANPPDTGGGTINWVAAARCKIPSSAQDSTFDGTVYNLGDNVPIPYKDARFPIPWP